MRVTRLDSSAEALADPSAQGWREVPGETIPLIPAPASGQPSRYVRSVFSAMPTGHTRQVEVKVVRCGDELLVRLEWLDATENIKHEKRLFPDAAAVMFPANGSAPLTTMGSPEEPVSLWYWRPDVDDQVEALTATGLGTVDRSEQNGLAASSGYDAGRWSVVLRGRRDAGEIAFAVWDGAAGERGGLKSVSRDWHPLDEGEGGGK